MSNKQFISLIAVILLGFFGWLYYDSQMNSETIRKQDVRRDILADGANGDASAQIQYLYNFPPPVYSHSLSTPEIEALSRAQGGGENEHYHVYGLTQAEFQMKTLYEFNSSKKMFQDQTTMWVENLRVEFSYTTVNVFVTSAYAENSCEYQATLAHENQHLEIHRKVYAQYQKVLEDALAAAKDIPLSNHPIVVTSREAGKEQLAKMISSVTDPVFEQFQQTMAKEQAELDTQESYAELRGRCQNW